MAHLHRWPVLLFVVFLFAIACSGVKVQSPITLESVDDCYWRLRETERNMFKLYTVAPVSPELDSRLKAAWQRVECKADLPPAGELYIVKKPKPE